MNSYMVLSLSKEKNDDFYQHASSMAILSASFQFEMVDRISQCFEQKAKVSHFNLALIGLVLRTRQYPYVLLELILLGLVLRTRQYPYVLLELTLYIPVNNFSVMSGCVFPG